MSQVTGQQAEDLMQDVAGIKAGTRTTLRASQWQTLVIWSIVFLGAALTGLVQDWSVVADIYWLFAVPIALVLTAVVGWRVDARAIVRRRPLPYWLIGLGITVLAGIASVALPDPAIVVAIWVILGFGFAGFAWLDRLPTAAIILAAMGVLSGLLGFVVEDTYQLYPILALGFSVALGGIAVRIKVQAGR